MKATFVHTADWQIGKRFGGFSAEQAPQLRAQRLDAVDRVARAAIEAGASAVLVAGDVFDGENVAPQVSAALLARLKNHAKLQWHLLPGNHDPSRAGGIWEALISGGLPENVRVHTASVPAELMPGVIVLPAPLVSKSTSRDPTEWMDAAETPSGVLRIGLAHGSVQGFGSAGDANVQIDPARVKAANLAYLALGDWHGTTRISERVWYSGTPEPDGFRDNEPGHALVVRIDGPGAVPDVTRVATAHYSWTQRKQEIASAVALDDLEGEIDALGAAASRRLVALKLDGLLPLAAFADAEQRLDKLAPRLFHLERDLSGLQTFAAESDLAAMKSDVLAAVARKLKSRAEAEEGGAQAARALRKLYALARRVEAGGLA
jgi:DNA repair exonuclease SbcCD nuclease subunit